ncbi:hypothetical protein G6F46_001171 [Rhizopus delemar]|uniref:Uncharacterized protein n=2 Tax=Rhizopus TaxID=4842 RepID=A0A9P6Z946_9FUNG|nr:hypothetical protein G6F55_005369 [Rhizopus delemar]KAG1550657.1 hypothetical protein G6F51_002325 [Rhizopus arrhizus]KAG1499154.1 hypothetical protein G6F54_004598 [Rhizopus delemar]KAG1512256.1 hypothetical protein G6F53_005318 [Rhizopus delemar]KAG1526171.1 hypothetical protein G6F52_002675 [Rhizopus delemar]
MKLSITFYRFLPYLEVLVMHHNSKQLEKLQADLAAAHAEIRKLRQENAFLWKQLSQKPTITDTPPSPSGCTTSPTVSSFLRSTPTLSKHPHRLTTPPLLFLRLLRQNAIIPNLALLLLPGNSLYLLNQQALNASMYSFETASLYNHCAPTSADDTLTLVEFWIPIIQIEIGLASFFILVMKLSSVHN